MTGRRFRRNAPAVERSTASSNLDGTFCSLIPLKIFATKAPAMRPSGRRRGGGGAARGGGRGEVHRGRRPEERQNTLAAKRGTRSERRLYPGVGTRRPLCGTAQIIVRAPEHAQPHGSATLPPRGGLGEAVEGNAF